ncbi:MAG TPA: polymer-forming cytoskeletal protein, partial [Ottowia sp.]|nr:polymer-forming cytoskeletal protein [Ottowia sp.]
SVVGPVLARELLELQSRARVQGDVRYKTLEMQQGAVIAGQLQPQLTPPPSAAPAAPTEGRAAHEPAEPTFDGDLDRP